MSTFRTVAACMALAAGVPAVAQSKPRDLTGTVSDEHHEPLSGAVVQVHDESTGSVVSYITDRSGRYSFQRLSSDDDYSILASYRGHSSKSRVLSKFDSNPNPEFPLVIKFP